MDRPLLLRRRCTPTATPSSCSRRFASLHAGDLFARKGHAAHRHQQRRQRRRLSGDAEEGGVQDQGVDSVITGHSDVVPVERPRRIRRIQPGVPGRARRRPGSGQVASTTPSPSLTLPDKFKDYADGRPKDNVTKIYGELKK